MTSPDPAVRRLAKKVGDLADQLAQLQDGIGLGSSSFDDGQIQQYTDGTLGGAFGTQYDGTNGAYALNGPPPPTPAVPFVEAVNGGLRIRWQGDWKQPVVAGQPVVAPMDFSHVEYHVSTDMDFSALMFDTLRSSTHSARGGEVLVPLPAEDELGAPLDYYVRLVARSTAGKASVGSDPVGPFRPLKVRREDLAFNIDLLQGSTIFWGDVEPTTDKIGDLWLKLPENEARRWDGTTWALVIDQASIIDALTALIGADELAVYSSKQATTADVVEAVASGQALGTKSIKPNSLIARDVVATGTISAALLEAILILTTTIVAGNPTANHVKITETGIYVYAVLPSGGDPVEIIRLGTGTSEFFSLTDSTGMIVLSLDDTGAVNGRTANFREDIIVAGRSLMSLLEAGSNSQIKPGARTTVGYTDASITGVTTEIGLLEVSVPVDNTRRYRVGYEFSGHRLSCELRARIRDGGTGPPSVSSPVIMYTQHSDSVDGWDTRFQKFGVWEPATSGDHRLLLTVSAGDGSGGTVDVNTISSQAAIFCEDLGPRNPVKAQVNRGGGGGGVPPRQYDTGELTPTGWASFKGDLTATYNGAEVIQGYSPDYPADGDNKGYWWWPLPSITGTVDRVDVYLYANYWHYSSGGTALINLFSSVAGGASFTKMAATDLVVPAWSKPGGRWVTLPADWWVLFKSGTVPMRADGISIGPSGGTNPTYYGRFQANAARMRIWYSQ